MSQWLRYALIVGLLLAITYPCAAAPAYVIVDQSVSESGEEAWLAGDAYAKRLEERAGIHDAEVIVLPMKAVRIVAMTQVGKRKPNFEKVSEPVASPNEMTNQFSDLLSTLPNGSIIFKMGKEDAAWNEASVVSENEEFLNEIPIYDFEGSYFDVLDFYLHAETTLNSKAELDKIVLDQDLHMNWIWNKPAVPLAGYSAAWHPDEMVDLLPIPPPGEPLTEEEMAEVMADPWEHLESARDDYSIGTTLAWITRMGGVALAGVSIVTGQIYALPIILYGIAGGVMASESVDVFVESVPYGVSQEEWEAGNEIIRESMADGRIDSIMVNLPDRGALPSNRVVGNPYELGERGTMSLLGSLVADESENPRCEIW